MLVPGVVVAATNRVWSVAISLTRGGVAICDARDLVGALEDAALWCMQLASGDGIGSRNWRCRRGSRLAPRQTRSIFTTLVAIVGVLAVVSSGWPAIREYLTVVRLAPAPPAARNVVLIVWDTVRAYNLGLLRLSAQHHPQPETLGTKGRHDTSSPGACAMDVPLARLLLYRPVAHEAQFAVEVHSRRSGPDSGRVPEHMGLSDRWIRGEHQLLQLRDRAQSGLHPFRRLCARRRGRSLTRTVAGNWILKTS